MPCCVLAARPESGISANPEAGLAALDAIADPTVQRFQPAWATRAHLLAEAGRSSDAAHAFARAISLTTEPVVRRHLERLTPVRAD